MEISSLEQHAQHVLQNLAIDDKILRVGVEAGITAGLHIIKAYHSTDSLGINNKANKNDLVTKVDLESSEILTSIINKHFPEHEVLSEEAELFSPKLENYTWILDPIDGTANFSHRNPDFGVSIGIMNKDSIDMGIIILPYTMDIFYCKKGYGTWLNTRQVYASQTKDLQQALISMEMPYYTRSQEQLDTFWPNIRDVYMRAVNIILQGSAAISLANVAAGRFEAYVSLGEAPKFWDIAAGTILIQEAGGKVVDMHGQDIVNPLKFDNILACGSKEILLDLQKTLKLAESN